MATKVLTLGSEGAVSFQDLPAVAPTPFPAPDPIIVQATEFNVKRFSARGDGVSNDTSAIQQALDKMTSGGELCFPKGVYLSKRVVTGVDPFQNWATKIKAGNITIKGDGIGQSVIRAMDEYTTLFIEQTGLPNISFRDITLQGCLNALYPDAGSFSTPTGSTGALVTLYGTVGQYIKGITFERVQLLDVKSVGLFLGYAQRVRLSGLEVLYYENAPVMDPALIAGNGPQVGVFSGAAPVRDFRMIGPNFNGNPGGTDSTMHGADGLVWIGKGGDIVVEGAQVRNYKLEGIQGNCGPFTANNNQFFSFIGENQSVAIHLFAGPGGDVDNPMFTANGNTVVGGSSGIRTVDFSTVPSSLTAIGNQIALNTNLPNTTAFSVQDHTKCCINSNVVQGCHNFFNNSGTGSVNYLTMNGNTVLGALDIAIMIGSVIGKTANIIGNTVQVMDGMNAFHLYAVRGQSGNYVLQYKDNIWLNNAGVDTAIVQSIGANSGAGTITVRTD